MGAERLKFNDLELDLCTYELRRNKHLLKLEKIPMELLILLVEKQGQLVNREEIIGRLWGKDVFLDTEQGINTAIRKIRQVLKDDPDHPTFIQTVVGKGYRFIAPTREEPSRDMPFPPSVPTTAATSLFPASGRWVVVTGAVVVFCILGGLVAFRHLRPRTDLGGRKIMLAVLPFENLNGDPEQEYFSDGITEEMITQLGRLSPQHLGVIARASVMRYKRSNAPISQIAEALGVDYVLEGSARRDKNRIRITAQLIQAHDQTHVWAEEYDRELRDVLALQREVSLEVADRVDVNLKVGLNASTPSTHPIKPDAYEDFLKGQFYLRGWTSRDDALEKAQHYFEHVLSLEPAYASAYAGLANVYFLQSFTGHSPKEVMPKAEDLAGKALQLDSDLAEAHDILAAIKFRYHWDWSGAEQEVKRALELNPSLPAPHSTYADYLGSMGRLEEALRENKIASIQDPLRPEMNFYVGESLMSLKRYDEALMQFRKMLELEPNSALAHVAISKVYAAKGMYNQAITERQNALVVDRDKELAELLGQTFAAAGYDAAKKVLRQKLLARLKQKAERGYVDPMQFALIYARLEDRDQTLLWLEKAYQARSPAMPMLNLLEEFDACRLDPRFQDLMRRVGLP